MASDAPRARVHDRSRIIMSIFTDMLKRMRALYETRLAPERLRPLAEMYWRFLLVVALLSIIAILMFGVLEFVAVLEDLGSAQSAGSSASPVALDRSKLESTLTAYQAREAEYQSIQESPGAFADPSK